MNKLNITEIAPCRQVIFLATSGAYHRQFFGTAPDDAKSKNPVCWSVDSKKPDDAVVNKQSKFCVTCSQNIQGSGFGSSKACKIHLKTAVCYPNMGDIYQLVLTGMSLFSKDFGFKQYAKKMQSQGIHLRNVITRICVEEYEGFNYLSFSPKAHLVRAQIDEVSQKSKGEVVHECLRFSSKKSSKLTDIQIMMGMSNDE